MGEEPIGPKSRERETALGFVAILWVFHAVNNSVYLSLTDTPPSYDVGFHLNLSLNFFERFLDFRADDYFSNLLGASTFYPIFGYMAATPAYLLFGIGSDAACLGNLFYLGILLYSVYRVGDFLAGPRGGIWASTVTGFFPFVFGVSRDYYLESALLGVTAYSVWRLLSAEGFASRRGSLLFGLSVGLGMMTKWTFPLFLIFPVAWTIAETAVRLFRDRGEEDRVERRPILSVLFLIVGSWGLFRATGSDHVLLFAFPAILPFLPGAAFLLSDGRARSFLINLVLSGAAAIAVCYPWYVPNWDTVTAVAVPHLKHGFVAPEAASAVSRWGLGSLLYYPFALESNLLGPTAFAGFVVALLLFPWRKGFALYAPILMWVFGPWIVMTGLLTKDPRFLAPFLPGVGLLIALSFLSVRTAFVRRSLLGLVLLGGFWQFGMNTYNLPLPAGSHFAVGPYGHFYSYWNHGVYGSGTEIGKVYPHRAIRDRYAEDLAKVPEGERKNRIRFLVDRPFFHKSVLWFLSRVEKAEWTAEFDRERLPIADELNRSLDSDAVLFAREDAFDDLYRFEGGRRPHLLNSSESSFFRVRFPEQSIFATPGGGAVVYALASKARTIVSGATSEVAFGDEITLASATLGAGSAAEGVRMNLRVAWKGGTGSERSLVVGVHNAEGERVQEDSFLISPGKGKERSLQELDILVPRSNLSVRTDAEHLIETGLQISLEVREKRDGKEVPLPARTAEGEAVDRVFFQKVAPISANRRSKKD